MKTLLLTTNKNLIATLAVAVIILLSGCKKDRLLEPNYSSNTSNSADRPINGWLVNPPQSDIARCEKVMDLVVPQNQGKPKKAGIVKIEKVSGGALVTYETLRSWRINSISLYVGKYSDVPINPTTGDVLIDQFPYQQTFNEGLIITSVFIPDNVIKGEGSISAHAALIDIISGSNSGSGWALGTTITPVDQAMWTSYKLKDCSIGQLD